MKVRRGFGRVDWLQSRFWCGHATRQLRQVTAVDSQVRLLGRIYGASRKRRIVVQDAHQITV